MTSPLDDRDPFSWDDVHLARQEEFDRKEAFFLQESELPRVW